MANGDGNRRSRWGGFDLGPGSGEPRRLRSSPWVWMLGFLGVLILFQYLASPRPTAIDYSKFLDRVEAHQIQGAVEISETSVSGTFTDTGGNEVRFTSDIPPTLIGTTALTDTLEENNVDYTGVTAGALSSFLLGWVAPLLLFGLLWFFLIRRMSGAQTSAALNLGRNRSRSTTARR